MKYEDTVASACRYGSCAAPLFEGAEVLAEDSCDDWQGYAKVVARKGEEYMFLSWNYGSCEECDGWLRRGLIGREVTEEMRREMVTLDKGQFKKFLEGVIQEDFRGGPDWALKALKAMDPQ